MPATVSNKVKLAILSGGLLSFIGVLVETSMNVTFPTLINELHVSLPTIQWLTTGYLLLVTIVMSTTAYILKRFAAQKIFLFATLTCLIGSIFCIFAPNFIVLMVGRLLQAISTGLSTPLMFHLIFSSVPTKKLGLYTGFASVIISLAPALGPTYGGVLTSLWSWRSIFIGTIPIIILVGLLGAWSIDQPATGVSKHSFDYLGVVGLAIVFTSIILTFNEAGQFGWLSSSFRIGAILSIIIIGLFIIYAIKGNRKLIDYSILQYPILRFRLFSYFGLQFINIGLSFILPLFAQTVLHSSAMEAGLMLLPGSLLGAAIGPIAGRIYDRTGPFIPLVTGGILMLCGTTLFWLLTKQLNFWLITSIYTLIRIGFNAGFGTSISDGSLQVPLQNKSDQNSLFSMMQQYAGSLGTGISAAVISGVAIMYPHLNTVSANVTGTRFSFILLIGLSIAILLSVIVAQTKYRQQPHIK
ncbi:major facilitator superfamily transporter [Paucilactobacillus hokkaidonensis JCM 18461]|uniref:Major facilitator superfamily transporter n=2 Tax=Paucilactobacillus hokkaidonensis TaxID=1193095 RepID=A0A0A1GRG8_9LACO|nr:MFS transporter [Paucilactobacillus hokkaidonensis]KRO08146.1 transport protein [Paucilactobacillus hokkaidonensis]BAP84902.1 major facilitator superfamily transporter [Paucilactobacillus hokkaidonensis JCM 18461]